MKLRVGRLMKGNQNGYHLAGAQAPMTVTSLQTITEQLTLPTGFKPVVEV